MGLTRAGLVWISLTPFSLLIILANRGEIRLRASQGWTGAGGRAASVRVPWGPGGEGFRFRGGH